MLAQADGNHPDLAAAMKHLLSSGGKRIRPAVTLLMGEVLGADPDRLVTLAAAIELLHTATLVHDDLIDGALLRRGISTLNAQWSPAATVLTGDFVFAQAAKLAAATNSVPVMHLFAEALITIVNGEINQLFSSKGLASREDYYARIHAKTASMFELATAAAATLAPQSEQVALAARQYGYEVGMAFQIVDDILDFTGEEGTVGKPVASDLRLGLITLPAIYYLEACPNDPQMRAVMNGSAGDEKLIRELVISIRQSGAVEQALAEASQFVERGLHALAAFPPGSDTQGLADLANFIIQRNI